MVDDIMLQAEERMERALASLGEAFGSVRTGRANALLLDRIKVDSVSYTHLNAALPRA